MKDPNLDDMPCAILFEIEVEDSYKEDGPRIRRTIEVIAESYERAKEVYYEQGGRYECEFVDLIDACIAKNEDYGRAQSVEFLIDHNIKKKV